MNCRDEERVFRESVSNLSGDVCPSMVRYAVIGFHPTLI
jgi:hypothetical protein